MKKKTLVLLLSSIHQSTDPRIVGKIEPTLSQKYEVKSLLAGGQLPYYKKLIWRIVIVHPIILFKYLQLRPKFVQIFVAELLPLGFIFSWLGSKVIYEVQENLYKKIPTKSYNKMWVFEQLFRFFDKKARKKMNCVFTEDAYLNEYKELEKPFAVVHNFALKSWTKHEMPRPDKQSPEIFYAGVISIERAFDTIIQATVMLKKAYPNIKIHFFGRLNFDPKTIAGYEEVAQNLLMYGYTDQKVAFEKSKKSFAGLALLKPIGDYVDSYPSKIFDYMALGLPVITSNFELYKDVVEKNACGYCISPFDAHQLANVITACIENIENTKIMGQNGRNAIIQKYNWEQEGKKLLDLYAKIDHNF